MKKEITIQVSPEVFGFMQKIKNAYEISDSELLEQVSTINFDQCLNRYDCPIELNNVLDMLFVSNYEEALRISCSLKRAFPDFRFIPEGENEEWVVHAHETLEKIYANKAKSPTYTHPDLEVVY